MWTYDNVNVATNPVWVVRLLIADTDVEGFDDTAAFSDEEITLFLSLGLSDPMLAGAYALDAAAADASKASVLLKTEATTTDLRTMAAELAARAQKMREGTMIAPAVYAPDPVFTTDYGGGSCPGTMDCW
jgi:hypothetical protein